MASAVSDEDINALIARLKAKGDLGISFDEEEEVIDMLEVLKTERDGFADTLVLTEEHHKKALKDQASKAEAEFHAMTVEMREVNITRVIEQTGIDIVALANRCERVEKERDDLREALKIYQEQGRDRQNELFGSTLDTGPQRLDGAAPRHDD